MNEDNRHALIDIFSCVAGKEYLVSDFIKSTEATVRLIQMTDEWKDRMMKVSAVNDELDQLIKDLDKLSITTQLHLRRVSQEIRDTGVDPVTYLKLSATQRYYRPRLDKAVRLSVPVYAVKTLTSYGIPCSGSKNGEFVRYLTVLGNLLDWNFDAYSLARDYYKD